MQIERITCNRPERFAPIIFNAGERSDVLNVVYGEVQRPEDKRRDSHNPGKTTLIQVIDFLLLASVGKDHLFVRHRNLFEDLVFFMELRLGPDSFVGIRRAVAAPTQIDLVRADVPLGNLIEASDLSLSHTNLAFERAREVLDAWLDFVPLGTSLAIAASQWNHGNGDCATPVSGGVHLLHHRSGRGQP